MSQSAIQDAWGRAISCAVEIWQAMPADGRVLIRADKPPTTRSLSDPSFVPLFERGSKAIAELDALLPCGVLARDPDSEVWEALSLDISSGHKGIAVISIDNTIGACEHVTSFLSAMPWLDRFTGWAESRIGTQADETSWNEARKNRVVVSYQGAQSLIDPGVNRPIQLMSECGIETYASCEGHPSRAYLAWRPLLPDRFLREDGVVPDILKATGGWKVEYDQNSICVRMKPVADLAERDSTWRITCAALERHLGIDWTPNTKHDI